MQNTQLEAISQLIKKNQSDEAKAQLTSFLKQNPQDADAWYLASQLTDQPDRKAEALRRSLSANPNHTQAQLAMKIMNHAAQPVSLPAAVPTVQSKTFPRKAILPAAAVIALVLLGGSLLFLRSSTPPPLTPTLEAPTSPAAVPGAPQHIAYLAYAGNQADIWTVTVDGTGPTNITQTGAASYNLSWSPDGKYIAFTADQSGTSALYLMDADGTNLHALTTDNARQPFWSPDGKHILYLSNQAHTTTLFSISPTGQNVQQLTADLPTTPLQAALSPDGSKLAYTAPDTGSAALYLIDLHSTPIASRAIFQDVAPITPSWSPNSQQLAFASLPTNNLTILDVATLQVHTYHALSALQIAWAPDPHTIAYIAPTSNDPASPQSDLYLLNLADGSTSRITQSPELKFDPTWSPGGRRLTYIARTTPPKTQDHPGTLNLYDLDSTKTKSLAQNAARPIWQPPLSRPG